MKVSQPTTSSLLKRKAKISAKADNSNLDAKRKRTVEYPQMESALVERFLSHQDHVSVSGDFIKEKATLFLDHLYADHDVFDLSNGWLQSIKYRQGIYSFRRLRESSSVDMTLIEESLPNIREMLDKYEWKYIYNMDETRIFYRLLVCFGKWSCLQNFVTLCVYVDLFTGR